MSKLFYILPILLLLSLGLATAVADGCTNAYTWHDSILGDQNVSIGKVCINATSYDVAPILGVKCSEWYDYVDGACVIQTYYVGYKGDGTATCDATGWVSTAPDDAGFVSVLTGYIVNTTIKAAPNAAYETNTGEVVPAPSGCLNGYTTTGASGYCDGAGFLDLNSIHGNVTIGTVCSAGSSVAPNSTNKCANWANCVIGQCTAGIMYVGYLGDGTATCSNTGAVSGVGTGVISTGYRITATNVAASCTISNSGGTASYTTCTNAYTRNGTTGYCDTGVAQVGTLHVADGKVCAAGANIAPNSTLNCGTWYECVVGFTNYATYYTGYAAAGTACSATAWVATGNTYTLPAGTAISFTDNSATSCTANIQGDTAPMVAGINNLKSLAYAGFALLAVGILVIVSFGLIQIFKGGNVDFMTIAVVAISTGVVIIIAYVIIYFVAKALGA